MTESDVQPSAPKDDHGVVGPLVFISHDSRDALLAEALSKLLGSVSAGMLKTFRSSDKKGSHGFEYGVEWYPELMKMLESACDVVCLLTERSLGRPWILYQAGVAKGKLSIPVHGLAVGVPLAKASVGPFAQFQNCDDDVESITKLVMQLVRRLPQADPDHETIRTQVLSFKEKTETVLAEQSSDDDEDGEEHGEASTAKLFEEVKVMFQDLPSRLEYVALNAGRESRSRGPRLHPMMVEEMVMMISRGEPRAGLVALIMASFVRDDLPWLYEMGVEAYRASLIGEAGAERRAYYNFARALEFAAMGPFSRELSGGREIHMMLRDMSVLFERFGSLAPPPRNRTQRRRSPVDMLAPSGDMNAKAE